MGSRSRSTTWPTHCEAKVPDLEDETGRPGGGGRDERACSRVTLAPQSALDRHRGERDQGDPGDEEEHSGEVPNHVRGHGAELVAARRRSVGAENVVPTAGDREAGQRDRAGSDRHTEQDAQSPGGLEGARKTALDRDRDEKSGDECDRAHVRRQRQRHRDEHEGLPAG